MYLFSFRSRTQSMKFYDMLRNENMAAKIINTPRDISAGCGLSVAIDDIIVEDSKKILSYSNFDTFIGLFYISNNITQRANI